MPAKEHYLYELNGVRGIAALVVLIYHGLLPFPVNGFTDIFNTPFNAAEMPAVHYKALLTLFNGTAMVVLFFVLSGTVLSTSLAQRMQASGTSA